MRYLALGDSISIDAYTGVDGGGAASQLARKLGCAAPDFQDLTKDGNVTAGVLDDLRRVEIQPDVVTLTAGGNDFIVERPVEEVLQTLDQIGARVAEFQCPVIINTVYDPTDGDDDVAAQIGISPARRAEYRTLNRGIRKLARVRGFVLSDLETLFHGNGVASSQSWLVRVIEPNLLGATAIAGHWLGLLQGAALAAGTVR